MVKVEQVLQFELVKQNHMEVHLAKIVILRVVLFNTNNCHFCFLILIFVLNT